ncbi:unknown [Bacteroides sp. CAG:144]|nr:unknown [Bacteroides sp. CAG:144]
MAGFEAYHTGNNRTVDLSANTPNEFVAYLIVRSHHYITSRSAYYPDKRMRGDVGAYGSHVAVESTTGHNDVGRQSQPLGPFGRELAYGLIGRLGLLEKPFPETGEQRVEGSEKFFFGQTTPTFMPHGLMPASATTADNVAAVFHAGDKGRQPLAIFDDGIGFGPYLRVFPQNMQGFGPEPLRRVDTTLV